MSARARKQLNTFPRLGTCQGWLWNCHLFQVLIFSTMTTVLDIIEDYLSLYEWKYSRLDGSMPFKLRDEHVSWAFGSVKAKEYCGDIAAWQSGYHAADLKEALWYSGAGGPAAYTLLRVIFIT